MDHDLVTNLFSLKDLDNAWSLLQQASTITFLTHHNPDADGVSACAALSFLMERRGKKIETIYPTKLQTPLKRQSSNVVINSHTRVPDLLVACDTANYDRLYFPEIFLLFFLNLDIFLLFLLIYSPQQCLWLFLLL